MEADLKELARIENELLEESERLEALLAHKKTEHETLARAREERNGLRAKLEAEMGDKKAQLKGLKEDEQRLHELVASIQRADGRFYL